MVLELRLTTGLKASPLVKKLPCTVCGKTIELSEVAAKYAAGSFTQVAFPSSRPLVMAGPLKHYSLAGSCPELSRPQAPRAPPVATVITTAGTDQPLGSFSSRTERRSQISGETALLRLVQTAGPTDLHYHEAAPTQWRSAKASDQIPGVSWFFVIVPVPQTAPHLSGVRLFAHAATVLEISSL